MFTAAGQQWRRSATKKPTARVWADDPQTGKRRDLSLAEHRAFWSWAILEVLRHTGIRVESYRAVAPQPGAIPAARSYTRKPEDVARFYQEAMRRISALPGVERVALGTAVPWRDPGFFAAQFTVEDYRKVNGEEDPRAQFRTVSPGFFSALGVQLIAGRDFNDADRADAEKVVIISESLARRMLPSLDAVNRRMMWDLFGHEVHRYQQRAPPHRGRRGGHR